MHDTNQRLFAVLQRETVLVIKSFVDLISVFVVLIWHHGRLVECACVDDAIYGNGCEVDNLC